MKNSKLKIIISVFSMLLCISVYAQGPPRGQGGKKRGGQERNQQREKPDASQILSKLDTNNDKVIDKNEASNDERGKISEDFNMIDTNSDELISLEELEASLSGKKPKKVSPEKLLKDIDDDKNGKLNQLEVAAKNTLDLLRNFNDIDSNKDNELDLEELKAFYSKKEKPKRRRRN